MSLVSMDSVVDWIYVIRPVSQPQAFIGRFRHTSWSHHVNTKYVLSSVNYQPRRTVINVSNFRNVSRPNTTVWWTAKHQDKNRVRTGTHDGPTQQRYVLWVSDETTLEWINKDYGPSLCLIGSICWLSVATPVIIHLGDTVPASTVEILAGVLDVFSSSPSFFSLTWVMFETRLGSYAKYRRLLFIITPTPYTARKLSVILN